MKLRYLFVPCLLALATPSGAMPVYDSDMETIANGKMSSEQAVKTYLKRIAEIDDSGPTLNAVLTLNPDALKQAKKLDRERRKGRLRGPLHGVPILLKDNIEAAGKMPTTAGSLALKDNFTGRDVGGSNGGDGNRWLDHLPRLD